MALLLNRLKVPLATYCIKICDTPTRFINCHRCSVTKIHRATYARQYETSLITADGSLINIKYHEPRHIVVMPVDFSTLTEEERLNRIQQRVPATKVVIEDEFEETFSPTNYQHLWN